MDRQFTKKKYKSIKDFKKCSISLIIKDKLKTINTFFHSQKISFVECNEQACSYLADKHINWFSHSEE